MSKGFPDWHSGLLMQGLLNEVPTGVNMDDLGNMIALLKGMYNNVPTVLGCDENGNIKVNISVLSANTPVEPASALTIFKMVEQNPITEIKVEPKAAGTVFKTQEQSPLTEIKVKNLSGTANIPVDITAQTGTVSIRPDSSAPTFKTQEQSPLTSIQVEPKSGMGNLKCDINAQTLGKIITFPGAGTYNLYYGSGTVNANSLTTILAFPAAGNLIYNCWFSLQGTGIITNDFLSIYYDGVRANNLIISDFLNFGNGTDKSHALKFVMYDDKNFRYAFCLSDRLTSNGSAIVVYCETYGRTLSYKYQTYFST